MTSLKEDQIAQNRAEDTKMKLSPNKILGLLVFLLLLLFFILPENIKVSKTTAKLTSVDNKFAIKFYIVESDQQISSRVLEKLNLPQSFKDGVEFKLDATSSAKLAFAAPIEAKITFPENRIAFSGTSNTPFFKELQMEDFKLPKSTNLVLFGPNFKDFLKSKFKLPAAFNSWLEQNLTSEGQYLVVYGQNSDFVIMFKSESVDFEALKDIHDEVKETLYKKEQSQDIGDFHLLKLQTDPQSKPLTPAFYRLGQWVFMASSYESAQEFVKVQKLEAEKTFNLSTNKSKVAYYFLLKNQNENPINENFTGFIFPEISIQKAQKSLEHISEIELSLKAGTFSGLINIK